jgi:hypothetical protein
MVSAVTLGGRPKDAPLPRGTPMAPPATAKGICPRQGHQASPGLVSSAPILPRSPLDQVGPPGMSLRMVLRIAERILFPAPYLAVSRTPHGPNSVHGAFSAEGGEISWMVSAVTLGRQPKGAPLPHGTPMAPPATAEDICPRQGDQASPGLVSSAQILLRSPLDQVGPTRMNLGMVLRLAGRIPFPAPYLAVSRAPRGPNAAT